MSVNTHKAPRRELQDEVDALITWYEQNKPDAGKSIDVDCLASSLSFATIGTDGTYWYRGRQLVPVKKKTLSAKKFREANQARITRESVR